MPLHFHTENRCQLNLIIVVNLINFFAKKSPIFFDTLHAKHPPDIPERAGVYADCVTRRLISPAKEDHAHDDGIYATTAQYKTT
jgi:hypothetical protein